MVAIACLMPLETGQHQEAPPPLVVLPQVVLVLQGIIGCLIMEVGACRMVVVAPHHHQLLHLLPLLLQLLSQLLHLLPLLPSQLQHRNSSQVLIL